MKFLILLLLVISMQAGAVWVPSSNGLVCAASSEPIIKGGVSPWPWGREIIFPWSGIEGVWQASIPGCSSLFVFRIGSELENGGRYISISQYDPKQCREIANGVGYEVNRVVRAVLVGQNGSFELAIHAFDPDVLSVNRMSFNSVVSSDAVVVMRMRSLKPGSNARSNFKMERLKKSPVMLCE